jgi:hypothetical protein
MFGNPHINFALSYSYIYLSAEVVRKISGFPVKFCYIKACHITVLLGLHVSGEMSSFYCNKCGNDYL